MCTLCRGLLMEVRGLPWLSVLALFETWCLCLRSLYLRISSLVAILIKALRNRTDRIDIDILFEIYSSGLRTLVWVVQQWDCWRERKVVVVWFIGCRSSPDWYQRPEKTYRASHFQSRLKSHEVDTSTGTEDCLRSRTQELVSERRQAGKEQWLPLPCGLPHLIPDVVRLTTKIRLHSSFEDFCCRCLLLDVEIELLMPACYCIQLYVSSSYVDSGLHSCVLSTLPTETSL